MGVSNFAQSLLMTEDRLGIRYIRYLFHTLKRYISLTQQVSLIVDTNQALKFALDIARGMAFIHSLEKQTVNNLYLSSKHVMVSYFFFLQFQFVHYILIDYFFPFTFSNLVCYTLTFLLTFFFFN